MKRVLELPRAELHRPGSYEDAGEQHCVLHITPYLDTADSRSLLPVQVIEEAGEGQAGARAHRLQA